MKLSKYNSVLRTVGASPITEWVKNLPSMQKTQEMWVWSLAWEVPRKRKWQPTPVFLPEKSQGQRSLVDYNPKGCKELAMTEHNTIRFRDNINITVVTYYILKLKGKMSMIPLIDVKTVLTKCNTELFWWSSVDIPPASEGDMDLIPAPGRAHMPQRTGPMCHSYWAHAL